MASVLRPLTAAWLVAASGFAGVLVSDARGREPLPNEIGPAGRASLVISSSSSETGALLIDRDTAGFEWLPGRPLAGAALSETTLAIVTRGVKDERKRDREGCLLCFAESNVDGAFGSDQSTELPASEPGEAWSVAANSLWLFLGVGDTVYRARHSTSGVGEARPYASVEGKIVGLTIGGKGYLTALVSLVSNDESDVRMVFFDPTRQAAEPLSGFRFSLLGARGVAYASAKGDGASRLYVASPTGLHRIDLVAGAVGRPTASPTLVWRPAGSIRSLAGGPAGGNAAHPLYAVAGDKLHEITPRTER